MAFCKLYPPKEELQNNKLSPWDSWYLKFLDSTGEKLVQEPLGHMRSKPVSQLILETEIGMYENTQTL